MELALEVHYSLDMPEGPTVSILVIMELALEAILFSGIPQLFSSFNPCYYGIGFRRIRD